MNTGKYHAAKNGLPLCGTRGTGNRYNVVCLPPKEWNALPEHQMCQKCADKIRAKKAQK